MLSNKIMLCLILNFTVAPCIKAMQIQKETLPQQINRVCNNCIPLNNYKTELALFEDLCKQNTSSLNGRLGTHDEYTLLHYLIGINSFLNPSLREPMIACLLKYGANPSLADSNGNNSLHLASRAGWTTVAKLIEQSSRDKESLKLLITAKNNEGKTPLHLTSTKAFARWLINHEAQIDTRDDLEATPLHDAARYNRWRVLRELIKKKAPLEATDIYGNTPLAVAVSAKGISSVKRLLHYRANFAAQNLKEEKITPFQKALSNNYSTLIAKQFYTYPELVIQEADMPYAKDEEQKILLESYVASKSPTFMPVKKSLVHYDTACARTQTLVQRGYSIATKLRRLFQGSSALTAGIGTFCHLQSFFKGQYHSEKLAACTFIAACIGGLLPRLIPCKCIVDWTLGKYRKKVESTVQNELNLQVTEARKHINNTEFSKALAAFQLINPLHTQKARDALAALKKAETH